METHTFFMSSWWWTTSSIPYSFIFNASCTSLSLNFCDWCLILFSPWYSCLRSLSRLVLCNFFFLHSLSILRFCNTFITFLAQTLTTHVSHVEIIQAVVNALFETASSMPSSGLDNNVTSPSGSASILHQQSLNPLGSSLSDENHDQNQVMMPDTDKTSTGNNLSSGVSSSPPVHHHHLQQQPLYHYYFHQNHPLMMMMMNSSPQMYQQLSSSCSQAGRGVWSNHGVDKWVNVMSAHPDYLVQYLRCHNYILRGDGPLPFSQRHYIALMVSSLKNGWQLEGPHDYLCNGPHDYLL